MNIRITIFFDIHIMEVYFRPNINNPFLLNCTITCGYCVRMTLKFSSLPVYRIFLAHYSGHSVNPALEGTRFWFHFQCNSLVINIHNRLNLGCDHGTSDLKVCVTTPPPTLVQTNQDCQVLSLELLLSVKPPLPDIFEDR